MNEKLTDIRIINVTEQLMKSKNYIVFVDEQFTFKNEAYSYLEKRDDIGVITDPEIADLYRLYEFSDKFVFLHESDNYGSIWNYVDNKIITVKEALDALFDYNQN